MTPRRLLYTCLLLAGLAAADAGATPVAGAAPEATPTLPALPALAASPASGPAAPPAGAPPAAPAQTKWVFQAATGTAYQFRSNLVIKQDGEEDLDFTAHYETRPYTSGAPYYSLRLGYWDGKKAWELETHHHLVTLVDGPEEVQEFKITHGYNLNTLNRAWLAGGFIWRIGLGVVITHPESIVRGKKFEGDGFYGGFYLSGVCGQLSLEKRLALWGGLFAYAEGKFTAAWASVPVADGTATVPNYALHALAGIGYDF